MPKIFTVEALQGDLISISDATETITNRAQAENRDLTQDERTELDGLLAQFDIVRNDISRMQRATGNREFLSESPGRVVDHDLIGSSRGAAFGETPTHRPVRQASFPGAPVSCGVLEGLASLEGQMDGWKSAGSFLAALKDGDPRLRTSRVEMAASEGTGSEGGYSVPGQLVFDFLGGAFAGSQILTRVDSYLMASNNLSVVGASQMNHSAGSIAGLKLTPYGELEQFTGQTPALRAIQLFARKHGILVQASNELLEDSPIANRLIRSTLADAAAAGLEELVLTGIGIGQMLGILNDDSRVVVSKESGQTADTINFENVTAMLARLHPGLLRNAIWIASPSCLSQLLRLALRIENAAADDYVGGSDKSATADPTRGVFSLMGLPLVFSEVMPTLGDEGDILLCAPSQYAVGIRRDVQIDADTSLKFDFDATVLRLKVRLDGKAKWSAPMTPRRGDTLSWAIVLEAR